MRVRPWLLWLLVAAPLVADSSGEAWKALDAAASRGDLEAALEATGEMSATDLAAFLRDGRAYPEPEAGQTRVDLVDGAGTKSWGMIEVPSTFRPGNGVILLLHGLGDVPDSLMRMYRSYSQKEGLILAAPCAKPLAKEVEEADEPKLKIIKPEVWWSYKSHGFPLELLAEVKRRYDIDEDRVVLSGYSMGGFGAWNIGMRFPDRFAGVVAYAGGVSRNEWFVKEDKLARELLVNFLHTPIFFLHGDADFTVPIKGDRLSKKCLEDLGYDFVYREVKRSQHMLPVGDGSKLHGEITSWIDERRRDAAPAQVVHVAHDLDHAAAYWVRIDAMEGGTALVDAEWSDEGLRVDSEGVTKLTVFVRGDASASVRVTWNGKARDVECETGKPVLLESWLLHEDRRMVWEAKLSLSSGDDSGR